MLAGREKSKRNHSTSEWRNTAPGCSQSPPGKRIAAVSGPISDHSPGPLGEEESTCINRPATI
jgi:hypothetical protein